MPAKYDCNDPKPNAGYEVNAGTRLADVFGFTQEKFYGWLEILEDGRLYLYYICSKEPKKGHVTTLIKYWVGLGLDVRIVRPCDEMQSIIKKLGFVEDFENLSHRYTVEGNINTWRRVM